MKCALRLKFRNIFANIYKLLFLFFVIIYKKTIILNEKFSKKIPIAKYCGTATGAVDIFQYKKRPRRIIKERSEEGRTQGAGGSGTFPLFNQLGYFVIFFFSNNNNILYKLKISSPLFVMVNSAPESDR